MTFLPQIQFTTEFSFIIFGALNLWEPLLIYLSKAFIQVLPRRP